MMILQIPIFRKFISGACIVSRFAIQLLFLDPLFLFLLLKSVGAYIIM